MILDPIVNQLSSPVISIQIISNFQKLWNLKQKPQFDYIYNNIDNILKFHFPSYFARAPCEDSSINSNAQIMGTNANNQCVYWQLGSIDFSNTWECLNDVSYYY